MREVPTELAARLVAASGDLIASFDDVRMDDVARVSGIPRATLYYYFAGKDDVLAFLLRSMLDDLAHAAAAAATGPGDAPTRLRNVIHAQLEHLGANPATVQLLIANLGKAGKLPDIAVKVNEGFEAPVRGLLEEGAADGTLRALPNAELGATALFGGVLVVGLRALVVDGHIDADRLTEELGPMFWLGIAPATLAHPPARRRKS